MITPRGSTAVSGLELMTALRPPTRAVQDEATGNWVSGHNPGSLGTEPVDPAPPEATAEHPVVVELRLDAAGFLNEEAYQWVRPVDLLTDEECTLPYAVGIDVNTAFLAAAGPPDRRPVRARPLPRARRSTRRSPAPGWSTSPTSSSTRACPRRSPRTAAARRARPGTRPPPSPTPRSSATTSHPIEAYLRRETGAYLDPWHDRLETPTSTPWPTSASPRTSPTPSSSRRWSSHKEADPALAAVLSAIKATVKGGIGKLRERPQGKPYKEGEPWPAL